MKLASAAILLLTFIFIPLSLTAQTTGLIAHYTFDDGTVPGIFGNARQFDGTNPVTLPDSAENSQTGPITLSIWFKTTTPPGDTSLPVVQKLNSYVLAISGYMARVFALTIRGAGSDSVIWVGTKYHTDDRWHHLAGTFDGDVMRVYLDGALMVTKDTTKTFIDDTTSPLILGTSFVGTLDDFRLYNRALSENEITALYSTAPPQSPPDPATPTNPTTPTTPTTPSQPTTPTVPVVDVRTSAPPPISWTPPIGIPEPTFGIRETHFMYQLQNGETCSTHPQKCFNFGNGLEPYHDAGWGPYTHYIDNTSPAATDTNNPFGTHERPRKTINPIVVTLPAGSVVEVHGGPYDEGASIPITTQNGTKEQPIFFRGPSKTNRPVLEGMSHVMMRGPYLIVENFKFNDMRGDVRPLTETEQVHHISFRYNETVGYKTAAVSVNSTFSSNPVHDIVFYDNYAHTSIIDYINANPEKESYDGNGFSLASNIYNLWVVDNDISGMAGDTVGDGHRAAYSTHHVYVGRNIMHSTGENAVDFKEVSHVVVSQNKMYDFRGGGTGSDGAAVVVHYGPALAPQNTWFLYNEISDSTDKGIQVGGDMPHDVFFVGNIVHGIKNPAGSAWGFGSWSSQAIYLVGNTFYNVDNGIGSDNQSTNTVGIFAKNNTIGPLTNQNGYHVRLDGRIYRDKSIFDTNKFIQTAKIYWGATYDLATFKTKNQCANCVEGSTNLVTDQSAMDLMKKKFKDAFGFDMMSPGMVVPTPPTIPTQPTQPVIPIIGDFNNDGVVNSIDMSLMSGAWNQNNATYDLTKDGTVNTLDYSIMVRNWTS